MTKKEYTISKLKLGDKECLMKWRKQYTRIIG